MKSLYHTAVGLEQLKTFVAAVEAVGLVDLLNVDDYLTVFAPTDDAFESLSSDCVEGLLNDFENLLSQVSYHIVSGRIMLKEMSQLNSLRTITKDDLILETGRELHVNNARVITPNIECANGVIHIIDNVLLMKKRRKVRIGMYYKTGQLFLPEI
jgi:uncharacterized surface protein with fasciclin (FAS1) repeats